MKNVSFVTAANILIQAFHNLHQICQLPIQRRNVTFFRVKLYYFFSFHQQHELRTIFFSKSHNYSCRVNFNFHIDNFQCIFIFSLVVLNTVTRDIKFFFVLVERERKNVFTFYFIEIFISISSTQSKLKVFHNSTTLLCLLQLSSNKFFSSFAASLLRRSPTQNESNTNCWMLLVH